MSNFIIILRSDLLLLTLLSEINAHVPVSISYPNKNFDIVKRIDSHPLYLITTF